MHPVEQILLLVAVAAAIAQSQVEVSAASLSSNLRDGNIAYCGQDVVFNCTVQSIVHDWEVQPIGVVRTLSATSSPVTINSLTFTVTEVLPSENRIITTMTFTAYPDLQTSIFSVSCTDGSVLNPSEDDIQASFPVLEDVVTPNFSVVNYTFNRERVVTLLWQDDNDDEMVPTVLLGESFGDNCLPTTSVEAQDRANHNYTFPPFPEGVLSLDHRFCMRFENGARCVSEVVTIQPFLQPNTATTKAGTDDGTTSTVPDQACACPAVANIGLAVSLSVLVPSTATFVSGILLGLLTMYCVMRKKPSTFHTGVGPDGREHGGGPVYDEVSPPSVKTERFEMGENKAYGPTTARR